VGGLWEILRIGSQEFCGQIVRLLLNRG